MMIQEAFEALSGVDHLDEFCVAAFWAVQPHDLGGHKRRGRAQHSVLESVAVPWKWFAAFIADDMRLVRRRCMRRGQAYACVTFDGSPWGGGATLKLGIPTWADIESHPVVEYWNASWSQSDADLIGAKVGDPGSQALWEAFALCMAVRCWRKGVLQDAIAFRAKEPLLNLRMAEVALTTAPWGIELKA